VIKVSAGTGGNKIGPGITLKVMVGDQFSIKVSSWYKANGATPGTPVNPLTDLLSALIGGVGCISGGHLTATQLQTKVYFSSNPDDVPGRTTAVQGSVATDAG
jgi:hypothetical protein